MRMKALTCMQRLAPRDFKSSDVLLQRCIEDIHRVMTMRSFVLPPSSGEAGLDHPGSPGQPRMSHGADTGTSGRARVAKAPSLGSAKNVGISYP